MPTCEAEAIVLCRLDFGEADPIPTLLTYQHGKLAAIGKALARARRIDRRWHEDRFVSSVRDGGGPRGRSALCRDDHPLAACDVLGHVPQTVCWR